MFISDMLHKHNDGTCIMIIYADDMMMNKMIYVYVVMMIIINNIIVILIYTNVNKEKYIKSLHM